MILKKTANFYEERLGFRNILYLDVEHPHICMYKDDIEIILTKTNKQVLPNHMIYEYGYDAYIYINDQEKFQSVLSNKGVKIIKKLENTDYGNKEFVIEDVDGRWIAFGRKEQS